MHPTVERDEMDMTNRFQSGCDLSIIIVSWNVRELLRGCLTSIARASRPIDPGNRTSQLRHFGTEDATSAPTLEVIVVDNNSSDGTVESIGKAFPWVRIIANEENLGFTRGNNLGYAASNGAFVYFLNPDTELVFGALHKDSLWTLYQAVCEDETAGMAGPKLRYADNSLQPSVRRFPTPPTGFFESTWLGRAWPRNPWSRALHMTDWQVEWPQEVNWIVGAAMLCRRAALQTIMQQGDKGPFDEGYFMYSEEVDLALRLHLAEWRTLWIPQAVVIHYEGRSSDQAVAARHLYFNQSKVRYWRKWFGSRWSEALRRYLLLEYRGQILLERTKWLVGHKRPLRKQRIEVYKEVIASGLLIEQPDQFPKDRTG